MTKPTTELLTTERLAKIKKALTFYADQQKWEEYKFDQHASAYDRNTGSELGRVEQKLADEALQDLGALTELLASRTSPVTEAVKPTGYLFRLRYGPDHWSQQLMYSSTLPKEGDYKEVQSLYATPQSVAVKVTDEMANAGLAKSRDKSLNTLTNTEAMRAIITAALSSGDAS